jgi:hypothetical protein
VRQSQTPLQSDLHLRRGRASFRLTDVFAPISFIESTTSRAISCSMWAPVLRSSRRRSATTARA